MSQITSGDFSWTCWMPTRPFSAPIVWKPSALIPSRKRSRVCASSWITRIFFHRLSCQENTGLLLVDWQKFFEGNLDHQVKSVTTEFLCQHFGQTRFALPSPAWLELIIKKDDLITNLTFWNSSPVCPMSALCGILSVLCVTFAVQLMCVLCVRFV